MANAPYTRQALLESIATADALASTARTAAEYALWSNRSMELRQKAQPTTVAEEDAIEAVFQSKIATYA